VPAEEGRRLRRDVAMVALALLSIGILAAEELGDPDAATSQLLMQADLGIVAVFWVEYLLRYRAAADKRAFVVNNWYDLPGMVPILPGMEGLGGVRLLRLLRIMRVLRLVGALRRFERFDRFIEGFTRRSKLGYVALLAGAIIVTCAAIAWSVEPQTFPEYADALWWAIVTATTVGYGDYYPRTGWGRGAGVALMLLGVGLIGTFAGTLSSYLVERRFEDEAGAATAPSGTLASELERLARLHREGALSDAEFTAAKAKLLA
jgi:voltage-gated potassium channel